MLNAIFDHTLCFTTRVRSLIKLSLHYVKNIPIIQWKKVPAILHHQKQVECPVSRIMGHRNVAGYLGENFAILIFMEAPKTPENERDIEKEKHDFEVAIQELIVEAIDADFDAEAVGQLEEDIKTGKFFALGEMHGVKENPDIIYTLIKKFGFKKLGLEWNKKLLEAVRHFQEEGILDYDAILNSADGRITVGHFALLKKLKEENLADIFLFDANTYGSDRDEIMANEVIENLEIETSPTMVVAGNAHTNLREIRERDGTTHLSMVKVLQNKERDFSIGEVEYLSGEFFNNEVRKFGSQVDVENKKARFYKSEDGTYIFELPVATFAIVPNPTAIYIE